MWYGNDDAGDLYAQSAADYAEAMDEDADAARARAYEDQWDRETRTGPEGPMPRPCCEGCDTVLERDAYGATVDHYAVLRCEECSEERANRWLDCGEAEFPSYE